MASLRSHQFFCGDITGAGPFTLYTVPTGKLAVLKWLSVQAMNASASDLEFFVASTVDLWVLRVDGSAPATGFAGREMWVALTAGQILKITGIAGKTFGVTVSGYLYFV